MEPFNGYDYSGLSILIDFSYRSSQDNSAYDVELELAPKRDGAQGIRFHFGNVTDLKIDTFGGVCVQLSGFSISSISNRGWDRKRWEIGDLEDKKLFFHCEHVSVMKESGGISDQNRKPCSIDDRMNVGMD